MTSIEFRNFLDKCVANSKITDKERVNIEYTCAELQLRPKSEQLENFIAKTVFELNHKEKAE